ncbi:thioredoxin-disulfide reductase [Candidatus Dependentiae bacterium]|nr:thioredoxin-disulfide reductase [Candidatus Dependentiae bacterium]MCC7414972.1 thioredoxin-disulfide reductase [Campylobacterota bacterium]
MKDMVHNLIIIGSGPAGLTAGIYAGRAGLTPLIIDGSKPGGQLMGTSYVENWPGEKSILGPELMSRMREHAAHFGATFIDDDITAVDFSKKPFTLTTSTNRSLQAHAVIIASGASLKRLGVPGEDIYWTKGVTTCAVCDGAFYRDKKVIIVGGGDTAMEDASFMTRFTDEITIIHILDRLTASQAMQQRALNNPKIKILYSSTVTEIRGNGQQVTEIVVTNMQSKEQTTLAADGIFVAIGLNPNTKPFEKQLELLANGYIKVHDATHTSVDGVFVAGDVADFMYRQAITSAGSGCMAALDAERYLASL